MSHAFTFDVTEEKIGILTFNLPDEKVNKFSTPVMKELDEILDSLSGREDLACMLIQSNKKGIFIAGADINEIVDIYDPEDGYKVSRVGQKVFDKIAGLPFPTN